MQPVRYPQDLELRQPQIMPVLEREQIEVVRSFGGQPRRFAPGELVIAAGAPTPMFVVLEGSIDIIRNDGLGNELLIVTIEAGQFQRRGEPSSGVLAALAHQLVGLPTRYSCEP